MVIIPTLRVALGLTMLYPRQVVDKTRSQNRVKLKQRWECFGATAMGSGTRPLLPLSCALHVVGNRQLDGFAYGG